MAVLGSPSITVLMVSVDVKQHWTWTGIVTNTSYMPSRQQKKASIFIKSRVQVWVTVRDDDDVELNVLGCQVDILGTNCDQCVCMVQCCFTSTETIRLIRTGSPGRPPRLPHSSWALSRSWHRYIPLYTARKPGGDQADVYLLSLIANPKDANALFLTFHLASTVLFRCCCLLPSH